MPAVEGKHRKIRIYHLSKERQINAHILHFLYSTDMKQIFLPSPFFRIMMLPRILLLAPSFTAKFLRAQNNHEIFIPTNISPQHGLKRLT